jgi:putative salt-induced outer membrane protein YdiY
MKHIICTASVALLCSTALAQEAAEPNKATFETTLAAGTTLNRGNSENSQFNVSINNEGKKEGVGILRSGAEFNYAESTSDGDTETTSKNFTLFSNGEREIDALNFYYLNGKYFYDGEADVDYRITIGPGVGRYLIKNETKKLLTEIGPSYVWENVDGTKNEYMALRIGERYDHKLSDTSKLWQSAEILPQVDDLANYLVNFEIGVEAKLNGTLNLRVVLQDKYNSQPGDDKDKNDVTFIAGISVKL